MGGKHCDGYVDLSACAHSGQNIFAMKHTLEVGSVILRFGDRIILQDVYLRCETGRITGLLGLNGTGKSCLMRIAMGELHAEQQFIRLDDRVLTRRRRRPADLAYMPQYHFIPGFLTIGRILRDYGIQPDDLIAYFPEFGGRLAQLADELSGGELRLLEFFIVVRSDAKFVILDEPFSHVMPVHIGTMTKIIETESQRKGILLSDHLFREVLGVCDDIYLAENTHVRLISSSEELVRCGYTSRV